jgi:hypothetical protein
MTRGILIAGNESALVNAIAIEAAKRVEHFAFALIPNRFSEADAIQNRRVHTSGGEPSAEKARIHLDWNPGSPISTRTLIIAAENRLDHIDEAILVCSPPAVRRLPADISFADIEVLVSDHIKGWFFLAKELAAVFRERETGTLALVYPAAGLPGGKDDAVDLLGPPALAAFQALTRSLLASAFNEPYLTLGFSGPESGEEAGFAAFIIKQMEDSSRRNNGKIYKYGKLNLFR